MSARLVVAVVVDVAAVGEACETFQVSSSDLRYSVPSSQSPSSHEP